MAASRRPAPGLFAAMFVTLVSSSFAEIALGPFHPGEVTYGTHLQMKSGSSVYPPGPQRVSLVASTQVLADHPYLLD